MNTKLNKFDQLGEDSLIGDDSTMTVTRNPDSENKGGLATGQTTLNSLVPMPRNAMNIYIHKVDSSAGASSSGGYQQSFKVLSNNGEHDYGNL